MCSQILGFLYDFSLSRAKGQLDQWCIYTSTCTWAIRKRKGLESTAPMASEFRMEHIWNRMILFFLWICLAHFFLPYSLWLSKVCPSGCMLSEISSESSKNFLNLGKNPVVAVKFEFTQGHCHPSSSETVFSLLPDHFTISFLVCFSPKTRETFFKASTPPERSTKFRNCI